MIGFQSSVRLLNRLWLPTAACGMLLVAGCTEPIAPVAPASDPAAAAPHVHAHPSEGPHHGDLVELGNEEFHAEVVHGKGGSVSVYILDSAARAAVPIDAADLTINITHDGNAEQFKLAADRDESDPEGKSSRFSLTDAELAKDLDDHHATAKLVVMIDGKSFSGAIVHQHADDHKH